RAGEPIVFDIFPAEPDGYWHDCTRTYAFSSPQTRVKEMYDAVLEAQTSALDMVREQASCSEMMIQVCKLFEKKGYPTARLLAQNQSQGHLVRRSRLPRREWRTPLPPLDQQQAGNLVPAQRAD